MRKEKKRRLPIGGVQTFSNLRKNYDVYVDKTEYVHEMVSYYKAVFLSRPRRFGKSLLCSTIESLFRGERELFEGLYISETDWEWKEHPVIHLELAGRNYTVNGADVLINTLNSQLDTVCDEYGLSVEPSVFVDNRFAGIILALYKKNGPVVVVVDEYDSPLLSTLNCQETNQKIREILKGFYGVSKQNDRYLRFVFVTGVTKFAQVSVFSGFNQPKDISMASEYSDICGINHDELEKYFAPEIDAFAPKHGGREAYLEKLKMFYDGYCFTEDFVAVYNTYGMLNHFDSAGRFAPFWSMSGEPSFMRKYLESKRVDIVDIETAVMRASDFADYRDDNITLFPLLYQAGYLTIAGYDELTGFYKLSYPNVEIRQSLAVFLSKNYLEAEDVISKSTSAGLVRALLSGDAEGFMELLNPYLARVDYSLSSKITEYYFEFAVSNIINMLGLECRTEVHTSHGRMDCVILAGDYIYIFEFKVDKPLEDAIGQLAEKDYALIYADRGKKPVEIGVVFSRETRNVVEWGVRIH